MNNRCGVSWLQACLWILCAALLLCFPWMSTSDAAEVRNAVMRQVGDQVEVIYDLVGELGEREADVTVKLTIGGKRYEAERLTLKGDYGKGVKIGPGRRFAWEVLTDLPAGYEGEIAWEVTASGSSGVAPLAGASLATFTSPTLEATFVLIPAGTFTMGSPSDDPERDRDERQHQVTISRPYYLQTTEVTQGQWHKVMGNNPSHFKNCGDGCPVEKVSWDDVQKFIHKLNSLEDTDRYRLPTEAEWEYAARAGTTTVYSSGYSSVRLRNYAWYNENSGSQTHAVGVKQPNGWGLYDMHGNVSEWVQDWLGSYPSGSVTDPTGPSSDSSRSSRVIRGGSWRYSARVCRSAYRGYAHPDFRLYDIGFRLARAQ